MPTLSVFYGILIQMFFQDHAPPHFHALYAEHEALIDIRTLQVIGKGSCPDAPWLSSWEWAEAHQDELVEAWDLCARNKMPNKIAPLK